MTEQKTNIDQYQLYHDVVSLGITCGLPTPQEWIRNYERAYDNLYPYSKIPDIEKVIWSFVVPSLYHSVNLKEEKNPKSLFEWVYSDK